jgi:LemA protein
VEPLIVPVAGVLVLAAALLVSYNRFVEQQQLVRDSWANVETELQRRYDLIPNLVETVRGYAAHEEQLFREVAEARARAVANHGEPDAQARDENAFVAALRHLFAVSEGYPELEASRSFLHLQRELTSTEDRIQAARRFYNGNVRDLNRRVESVPSNLVAGAFGFTRAAYFEVEPAVREAAPPAVDV